MKIEAEVPIHSEEDICLSANINPAAEDQCNADEELEEYPLWQANYKEKDGACPHFKIASTTRVVQEDVGANTDEFDCFLLDVLNDVDSTRKEIQESLKKAPKNCKLSAAIRILNKLKPSDH